MMEWCGVFLYSQTMLRQHEKIYSLNANSCDYFQLKQNRKYKEYRLNI